MASAAAILAALLLAGTLLAAPPAQAQPTTTQSQGCLAPVIIVQDAPRVVRAGSSYSLLFAIENPNGPPVEAVRATVTTTAPAGWTAVPAQRDLTLGPLKENWNALAITAPTRGTGELAGNITILVSFTCTSGEIQKSSFTTHTIEAAIEGFRVPWGSVLGGFALLVLGVVVLSLRRLRRGVAMGTPTPERPIPPGKSAKFTFLVENRRGKPQSLRLVAEGVPEGWSLHLALTDVELEPGEEKSLWAILKAPGTATPGHEVDLVLRLLGKDGREGARLALKARVTPEEGRPAYSSSSVA